MRDAKLEHVNLAMSSVPHAAANDAGPVILLADADAEAGPLAAYLELNGLRVSSVRRGDDALDEVSRQPPDLVVTEVTLAGLNGFELCRQLRDRGYDGPLVMLSRRDEDYDRVLGLEFGADLYLTKPIEPRVLLAQLKAILRRGAASPPFGSGDELRFGTLVIVRPAREVFWGERRIDLTAAEFDLLWLLAARAGEVILRDELLRALRGLDQSHEDRSMDTRLYRLRRRFGDMEVAARRIKRVRPHGYMFSTEPW